MEDYLIDFISRYKKLEGFMVEEDAIVIRFANGNGVKYDMIICDDGMIEVSEPYSPCHNCCERNYSGEEEE